MNTCIETLNQWSENALAFAWPMLWQSSLLIVIIFALDVLSARKIRPAIRHALWMIVLVKLLLPPALALPTGAAWWLWPAKPALTPLIKSETVTYDTTPLPEPDLPSVALAPSPPRLDADSWVMLASGAISAGLLCWLAFKWLSVGGNARRAKTAYEFENLLDDAQQLAGLRGAVRLRLIDDEQSPAVYGLFRPVILLPRALAEKLSGKQLRAVLLHEAIHVRRGDVWINCAQTLLQIFYWWHPLLWFANARIRRLREEAVDDAVMLALRDEADAYAPTLLEVAKFAFRRPLASLGLVGILESRSALRQRIERLVDFRPPHKAGVTLLSLCGIFAFSAVALPMGQAPVSDETQNSSPALPAVATSATARQVNVDAGRAATYGKLKKTIINFSASDASLEQMLGLLTKQSRDEDPDHKGIHFEFKAAGQTPMMINPTTGLPLTVSAADIHATLTLTNVSLAQVSDAICMAADHPIKYSVEDDAVVFANRVDPVGYETRTFKVDSEKFRRRLEDKLPSSVIATCLYTNAEGVSGLPDVTALAKQYFSTLGVNLNPPKAIFFNDHLGLLFVHATPQDLDVIERAVETLAYVPPQIHIKARFIDMPSTEDIVANMLPIGTNKDFGYGILTAPQMKALLHQLQSQKGVEELAEPEAITITGRETEMRATETQQVLTNYLFELPPSPHAPAVVAQVGNVDFGPMFDVMPIVLADGYTVSLKAVGSRTQFFGYADPKGFQGFTTNYDGSEIQLPVTLPAIQVSSASAQDALLYDSQTLVLFAKTEQLLYCPPDKKSRERVAEHIRQAEKKNGNKTLAVFVTVRLIDPAGNRIHSDEEMPFAQNGIPPQPQISDTVVP